MLKPQFVNIIQQPHLIESAHMAELELIVKEYPFFESAHLLYTKGLHKYNALQYPKQLRKTAVVANSRTILYELLHPRELVLKPVEKPVEEKTVAVKVPETIEITEPAIEEPVKKVNPVSITDTDIKIVYVNTVPRFTEPVAEKEPVPVVLKEETPIPEIEIVQAIENETEAPASGFSEEQLNKTIGDEINRGIIQSYVETDIIKTRELHKEEHPEPSSFTDWLKTIQKEAHTFQVEPKKEPPVKPVVEKIPEENQDNVKKTPVFEKKRQLIDKIIESDPGRIKLGSGKFFTPVTDAKQSLLENEHLVTETLAKIYALQGNISKAIRAYEILSLKFPQKSVYFASLIEKLKTNK